MGILEQLQSQLDQVNVAYTETIDQRNDLLILAKEKFLEALNDIGSWIEVDWNSKPIEKDSNGIFLIRNSRYFIYLKDKSLLINSEKNNGYTTYKYTMNTMHVYIAELSANANAETIKIFMENELNKLFEQVVIAVGLKHSIDMKFTELNGAQINVQGLSKSLGISVDDKCKEAYIKPKTEPNKINSTYAVWILHGWKNVKSFINNF